MWKLLLAFQILFPILTDKPAAGSASYYSRSITIPSGTVGSDLTNFTMTFSGTYSYLAYASSGGKAVNSNSGKDIVFGTTNTCSTLLKWDSRAYTSSTGAIVRKVKISITAASDTVFYMCYGDSSRTTEQSDAANAYDASTSAVYGLDDGTTLSGADNKGGTTCALQNTPTAATGKVNGSGSFNGTSQYCTAGNVYDITSNITLMGWIYPTNASGGNQTVAGKGYNGTDTAYEMGITAGSKFRFLTYYGSGGVTHGATGATSLSNSTWYHVAGRFDGSTWKVYVNGAEDGTSTDSSVPKSTAEPFTIGALTSSGSPIQYFAGRADEVIVASTNRHADWIAAVYANENSPGTFYTIGSEVSH